MDAFQRFKLQQQQNDITDIEVNGVEATKLKEPVLINGVEFDGSENITIGGTGGGGGGGDATSIGGYIINLTGIASGDHLQFSGSQWINVNKPSITT